MKDFPFSFENLDKFSQTDPYSYVPQHLNHLYENLCQFEKSLRFPAIRSDVGRLLAFFHGASKPKRVFEMGSGYGHSAFWHFVGAQNSLQKVVLTEKREDLKAVFEALPWPLNWKKRIDYRQGDAFKLLESEEGNFDFFLVDGVKGSYLDFIKVALERLADDGVIAVDNSYWRGSFLNAEARERKLSARAVFEMHRWIKQNKELEATFVPFVDGLTLIRKRSLLS